MAVQQRNPSCTNCCPGDGDRNPALAMTRRVLQAVAPDQLGDMYSTSRCNVDGTAISSLLGRAYMYCTLDVESEESAAVGNYDVLVISQ